MKRRRHSTICTSPCLHDYEPGVVNGGMVVEGGKVVENVVVVGATVVVVVVVVVDENGGNVDVTGGTVDVAGGTVEVAGGNVVVVGGTGDVWAWAGTTMRSKTGFTHFAGRTAGAATPPMASTVTRRRRETTTSCSFSLIGGGSQQCQIGRTDLAISTRSFCQQRRRDACHRLAVKRSRSRLSSALGSSEAGCLWSSPAILLSWVPRLSWWLWSLSCWAIRLSLAAQSLWARQLSSAIRLSSAPRWWLAPRWLSAPATS